MGPRDPITAASEDLGVDLEAEIVVITNDVPLGVNADDALRHIVLLGLVNDVTLRNVVLPELARASASCKASRPRRCRRCWSRRRAATVLARRQAAPAHAGLAERQAHRPAPGRRGNAVPLRRADRACGAHAPPGRRHAAGQRHDLQRQRRGRRLLPGGSARARSCAMAKCARHSSSMATACGSACATMPARACSAISTRWWKSRHAAVAGHCRTKPPQPERSARWPNPLRSPCCTATGAARPPTACASRWP